MADRIKLTEKDIRIFEGDGEEDCIIIENNGNLKRLHAKSCNLKDGLSTKELVKFYRKYGFNIVNTTHPYGILMTRKVINHCVDYSG